MFWGVWLWGFLARFLVRCLVRFFGKVFENGFLKRVFGMFLVRFLG